MTAAKTIAELDDVLTRMSTSRVTLRLVHYNIALSRYYLLGSPSKAELLLASMKEAGVAPDIATFNVQLSRSVSERNDVRTAALLKEIQTLGLQANDMTHALLCKHWVEQGDFKSVELLLDNLSARNVVPNKYFWSKLIDGYARQSNAEAAERTVGRMARLGLELDIYSMSALLSAYVNAGAIAKCRELMARVVREGLKSNSVVWCTYITGLLREPHVPIMQRLANAEEALKQMREIHVPIDSHIASAMLRGYNDARQWERGRFFLQSALSSGLRPSSAVFNGLMTAWIGQGKLADAEVRTDVCRGALTPCPQSVLGEIVRAGLTPTIISYNILIGEYCERGQGDKALELLKRAQAEGVEADVATYDIIAKGLLKKGDTAAAAEVMTQMIGKRMEPSRPAMHALIRQLTEARRLKEAEDWIGENQRLGHAPTLQIMAHLVLKYGVQGDEEKAGEWRERLLASTKYSAEEKDRALRWCAKHTAHRRTEERPADEAKALTAEQELQQLLDA